MNKALTLLILLATLLSLSACSNKIDQPIVGQWVVSEPADENDAFDFREDGTAYYLDTGELMGQWELEQEGESTLLIVHFEGELNMKSLSIALEIRFIDDDNFEATHSKFAEDGEWMPADPPAETGIFTRVKPD